jgi:uncharacterized protein
MNPVFVDSAYLIALAVSNDQHHRAALNWASEFEKEDARFVTTRAVCLEIGSALCRPHLRAAASRTFDALENDHRVALIELTPALVAEAQTLFRERPDKEWSLGDCISFVVMNQWEISDALTTDIHFEQAGFRALLRQ